MDDPDLWMLGMHMSGYVGLQTRVFPVERSTTSYGESRIFGYQRGGVDIVSSGICLLRAGWQMPCSLTTQQHL